MRSPKQKNDNGSKGEHVSPEVIKQALDTQILGRSIVFFEETSSTNDDARRLAEEGAVEGTTVIAGFQTCGRGRLGREWVSPRGGVWMSVVLRPASIRPLQRLTLLSGLSIAKALRSFYGIDAVLKWPNDILVGTKKICGILSEGSFQGDMPLYIVVGVGMNANIDPRSLPGKLRSEATSIRKVLRRDISLNELIVNMLKTMDSNYVLYARGEDRVLWQEYTRLCTTIGSDVRVSCGGDEVYEGMAIGISSHGGLVIRTKQGSKITVLAGDCVHLRKRITKNIKGRRRKLTH